MTVTAGYSEVSTLASDSSAQNVRLIDPQLVSEAFTQQQQVRGFYEFNPKLDIDRYTIGNKTQDYVVGVREIRYDQLQQNNWQNRHSVYTHGYGFVAAPASQVVCSGQPFYVSGFLATTIPRCGSARRRRPGPQRRQSRAAR